MNARRRLMAIALAASLLTLLLGPAAGTASADVRKTHAVFVQSNDPTGNDVLAYRAPTAP